MPFGRTAGIRQISWSGAFIGWAVWSPDDKDIYISGYKQDPASVKSVKIWKVRADSLSVETSSEGCGDGYANEISPDGKFLLVITTKEAEAEKAGIYQLSVDDTKCTLLAPRAQPFISHFSPDGKSFTYPVASREAMTMYRQPWLNGQLTGPRQPVIELPFAFRQNYQRNEYDYSRDLSTIVYARPGGQSDLYYLSQK